MVYVPGAALKVSEENVAREEAIDVEDQKIRMLLDFAVDTRGSVCLAGLTAKEEELWEAECLDALEMICSAQRTLRLFYAHQDRNVRGQAALTWVASMINGQIARSLFAEDKYRRSRVVLLSLHGPGDWERRLQALEDSHVQSMAGADFEVDTLVPLGKGHRVIS